MVARSARFRDESERFRRFTYDELVARDKASLDIIWLKDDSLEDTENLPPPPAMNGSALTLKKIPRQQFAKPEYSFQPKLSYFFLG